MGKCPESIDNFLTGIEKTYLVGKCPEIRYLPHGYRENISRGEVVLRSDIFLTGIEKTHLVGKCPESRQLPHGYRENTSRGEVS